jgi:nucleoside-diphosphate-sugar epimerase
MRRVAVIGASGFVGSTVLERLLAKGTDDPLAFVHSSGNAMRLARRGIELRMLDLLDANQAEAALVGVTHVINCSRGGDEVMLKGLKNLLAASRQHRVQRFVHLSSVAVYGDPPPVESEHEDAPTKPERGTYGWIKLQQDQLVKEAAQVGVPSIILCPPNISGPYSDYLVSLLDTLRSGRFAMLHDGTAPCNLVDVSNLSHAIELALENGPADGSRFFVIDDGNITWRSVVESLLPLVSGAPPVQSISREELSRHNGTAQRANPSLLRSMKHLVSSDVREALRKDPLWYKVDRALRQTVSRMGASVENRLRISVEGPIKVPKVAPGQAVNWNLCRQQLRGVRHSSDLAKSQLGYRPLYSVADSMEAFRRWYRSHYGMDTAEWPLLRQLY